MSADALTEAAELHLRGLSELRAENATLTKQLADYERNFDIINGKLEYFEVELELRTKQRDFYMRYTVKLHTLLMQLGDDANNLSNRVGRILKEATAEAFKPTLGVATTTNGETGSPSNGTPQTEVEGAGRTPSNLGHIEEMPAADLAFLRRPQLETDK